MRIYHSLPKTLPAEIAEPVQWTVEYFIPYALLEHYVAIVRIGPLRRRLARRNLGTVENCVAEGREPSKGSVLDDGFGEVPAQETASL